MLTEYRTVGRTLWTVFLAALAIRCGYVLMLYTAMGEAGLEGVDSDTYLHVGRTLAGAFKSSAVHGWDWFGPHPSVMPIYSLFLALNALLFGAMAPLASVLIQSVFDSATCVIVFLIAQSIDRRYALPASIAAVLNPTQIVISGLVYPDTLFVFFVSLSILGSVRWIQSGSVASAALIATGLVCAALIRVLIAPWTVPLLILLGCVAMLRKPRTLRPLAHLAGIAIAVALCVGAVATRNVVKYNAWAVTSQGGIHLLTVVPWVKQAHDGTSWTQGHQELAERAERRFTSPTDNPFEESRRYAEVANEEWRTLGLVPTAKAWIYGAVINLVSPAIILSPPIILIPRTGFYGTPGRSMIEKVWNFLFHSESAFYTWALLIGAAGLGTVRLLQVLGGAVATADSWRQNRGLLPVLLLFALWIGFILAVNGPVASPKYRLPIEPVLNILTGIGFFALSQWLKRLRSVTKTVEGKP